MMSVVTIILLVAVAAVAGIGVIGAARRGLSDERSSVRAYQQTLETLRHLSDHRTASPRGVPRAPSSAPPESVPVLEAPAAEPSAPTEPVPAAAPAPPAPAPVTAVATTAAATGRSNGSTGNGKPASARGRRVVASSSSSSAPSSPSRSPSPGQRNKSSVLAARSGQAQVTMRVDAPSRPARRKPEAPVPDSAGEGRVGLLTTRPARTSNVSTAADAVRLLAVTRAMYGPRQTRPALPSARRGERRPLLATVAAVVVVGTLTGVAVALRPPTRPAASTPAVQRQAGPAVHKRSPAPAEHPATAPSSAPTHSARGLVPVTASTTAATYDVPGSPFSVTLSATGPCWVEAADTATGQVLWEGTLQAGQAQTVPATGGLFLRLGNAHEVAVTEGGQTVQLPAGSAIVFDLTFVTT
jgi:type II secretory pathway pseudopilin PulG